MYTILKRKIVAQEGDSGTIETISDDAEDNMPLKLLVVEKDSSESKTVRDLFWESYEYFAGEGKKKQQQTAEQVPAPPAAQQVQTPPAAQQVQTPPAAQPGPSSGTTRPREPKKEQLESSSQGTQQGPKGTVGPQGDQPKKGKKGKSQGQTRQIPEDQGKQPERQYQQQRQERSAEVAPQQPKGGVSPQHVTQQPGQQQQQRGPAWGPPQTQVPTEQRTAWRQPSQQGQAPQQIRELPAVTPTYHQDVGRGAPPQGAGRGAPPQGAGRGAPSQGAGRGAPPQGAGRGAPHQGAGRGAPHQGAGRGAPHQGAGRGAPPQGYVPSQQTARGPQSQVGRGQQQPQQSEAVTPTYHQGVGQGAPPQGHVPAQQRARGPPPQSQIGRGQQQPQQIQGQQPSTSSTKSSVPPDVSSLQISPREKSYSGDAQIVSKSRIQPGKAGRRIRVESNHLQLDLGKLKTAYHYDVDIEPDKPKKYMRPVVESFRRKHFGSSHPAFDGKKNLYSPYPLTTDILVDEITLIEPDGREKKFKVQIKFANEVDLTPLHDFLRSPVTPQEAIQVVDIVLRMAPVSSCLPVGRSFFIKPENIIDLGQGMEMYYGFYQSAIRGWKPLLNVDVAHKAFPKEIFVVDALLELLNTGRQVFRIEDLRSLDQYQYDILEKFIKTLRITYQIPGHPESKKAYRVNGLGTPAQTARFKHDDETITVFDYFNRYKNYRLRYPMLPTLWVGNTQRPDKILLPLELCCICAEQAINRKMTDLQTSKMIKYAATNTSVRKGKIVEGINRANYNVNPSVREFGFSVGSEFQKLDARVLQPPKLLYANKSIVNVSKGVWRNESFLSAVKIDKWTFVGVGRYPPRPDDYRRMSDLFVKAGRDCGMDFTSKATEPYRTMSGRYSDIEQYFRQEKGKFQVIFVIVPDAGKEYSFVKRAAEVAVGCLTQCIKSGTVSRKMNYQTAVNILLKVNSKLNGINHTLAIKPDILKRPVMIMGADVTHPGPDARDIPSVAAVTASHDPKAFQYNICWRLQNPKVEIIEDLEAIVREHLLFFYEKTKCKPEAIIFFRDGVSEGQFEQVKKSEILAIRSACKKLQKDGYEPKISFLVVQKRHHTRLFPLNPRDSEDRNGNVPAGTCVDTDITHPFMQDFYLVSHASIQGVAKPTKYCTLHDDNKLDNDQIEELTYYLCHMFSRCNRSVSYPAPTYYAHLAAARAKVYIENDQLDMQSLKREFEKFQIKDEIRKGLPMFFV